MDRWIVFLIIVFLLCVTLESITQSYCKSQVDIECAKKGLVQTVEGRNVIWVKSNDTNAEKTQ
jgi:hypothetical protein